MDQEDADYADPDSRKFPLNFWSLLAVAVAVAVLSVTILKIVLAPPVKVNI
jgi:hypothetical protein